MPPADIPSVPGIGLPTPAAPSPSAASGTTAGGAGEPPPLAALGDQADIRPLDIPHALQILIFEVQAAVETALLAAVAPAAESAPGDAALLDAALTPATVSEDAALLAAAAASGGPNDGALLLDALLTAASGVPGAPAEGLLPGSGEPLPALPAGGAPGAPLPAGELATLLQPTLPLGAFAPAGNLGALSAASLAPPEAAHQVVELVLQALPPETASDVAFAGPLPALLAAVDTASAQALAIISSWRDVPVAANEAAQSAMQLIANVFSDEPLLAVWLRPEWAGFLPRLEQFRRRRRRLRRRWEDPDAQRAPHDETQAAHEDSSASRTR